MTKTKQDNNVIDYTSAFYAENVLNCHDRLDQEQFLMNTREDNDMNDRTSVFYVENDTELS